jgi:hypothetical protein
VPNLSCCYPELKLGQKVKSGTLDCCKDAMMEISNLF